MDDTYAAQAFRWMTDRLPDHEAGWTVKEIAKGIHARSEGALANALRGMCAQPFGPFAPGTEMLAFTPGSGQHGYGRRFRLRGTTGHRPPVPEKADLLLAFALTAGPKSARALAGTLRTTVDALQPTLDRLVGEGVLRTGPHYKNGFTDRRVYYSWQEG